MKALKMTHQQGTISLENVAEFIPNVKFHTKIFKGDIGIRIAADGRIWVCINGMAFLRFTPYSIINVDGE